MVSFFDYFGLGCGDILIASDGDDARNMDRWIEIVGNLVSRAKCKLWSE
jgi:hypothetical protein